MFMAHTRGRRRRWVALIALTLIALGFGVTTAGGWTGKRPANFGLRDEHLAPCPSSPNCVSSDGGASDAKHHVEPLSFNVASDSAWAAARQAALEIRGARVVEERDGYLWIEVTTRWMRFVDDVELRLDAPAMRIHVRSASRVGYSDFGTNRRRVEGIRARFNEQLARR